MNTLRQKQTFIKDYSIYLYTNTLKESNKIYGLYFIENFYEQFMYDCRISYRKYLEICEEAFFKITKRKIIYESK